MRLALAALAAALLLTGTADAKAPRKPALPEGAGYVAMGSSFGAGPGLLPEKPEAPSRCQRSARNYASLLAERLGLTLTDVTCGGATTTHLLQRWSELPPQVDAVQADTALVTITIGGNDVNYVRNLIAASCAGNPRCLTGAPASEDAWTQNEANMRAAIQGIRRRAPQARIVFVDYVSLLPESGACSAVAMAPSDLAAGRATATRLAALTARVASEEGAEVLSAAALSRKHTPCDRKPWSVGRAVTDEKAGGMMWHPNGPGMEAIAEALAEKLKRRR